MQREGATVSRRAIPLSWNFANSLPGVRRAPVRGVPSQDHICDVCMSSFFSHTLGQFLYSSYYSLIVVDLKQPLHPGKQFVYVAFQHP